MAGLGLGKEPEMNKLGLLGLVWILGLAAGAVWADKVAEPTSPPVEKVLTGRLSWETIKKADGQTVKGRLLLTAGDRQIALPVTSGNKVKATQAGQEIAVEKFLEKQVTLTAMVHEISNRKGMSIRVRSVTHIEETKQVETAAQGK
jgi:hypothetical protein